MTLSEFYEALEKDTQENGLSDKVVQIKSKYRHERNYKYHNEILIVDTESNLLYSWLYDWHEGQEDIFVLAWLNISDIMYHK